MENAFVLDISEADYDRIRGFNLAQSQALSWSERNRNKDGIAQLLLEAGVTNNPDIQIVDQTVGIEGEVESLAQFFEEFVKTTYSQKIFSYC